MVDSTSRGYGRRIQYDDFQETPRTRRNRREVPVVSLNEIDDDEALYNESVSFDWLSGVISADYMKRIAPSLHENKRNNADGNLNARWNHVETIGEDLSDESFAEEDHFPFLDLPCDCQFMVLAFMDTRSLIACARTCKEIRDMVREDDIWKVKCCGNVMFPRQKGAKSWRYVYKSQYDVDRAWMDVTARSSLHENDCPINAAAAIGGSIFCCSDSGVLTSLSSLPPGNLDPIARHIPAHEDIVSHCAQAGTRLISASFGTLKAWDLVEEEKTLSLKNDSIAEHSFEEDITSLCVLEDEAVLVSCQTDLFFLSLDHLSQSTMTGIRKVGVTEKGVLEAIASITCMSPAPGIRDRVVLGHFPGSLSLVDVAARTVVCEWGDDNYYSVNCLAGIDRDVMIAACSDRSLRTVDSRCSTFVSCLRGDMDSVECCTTAYSNGHRVFAGCSDGSIHLWDIRAGRHLNTMLGHMAVVRALISSSSWPHQLISTGDDGMVFRWEAQ